jgi:hypothetical protein
MLVSALKRIAPQRLKAALKDLGGITGVRSHLDASLEALRAEFDTSVASLRSSVEAMRTDDRYRTDQHLRNLVRLRSAQEQAQHRQELGRHCIDGWPPEEERVLGVEHAEELLFVPNLFVLGAAKCGTTSLHVWLNKHPEICMSSPKEPFFFESEFRLGISHYRKKYYAHWKGERFVGESRHRNLYLPYVASRVFSTSPGAKLIVLVRNPSIRAISHWWHWYSRGIEKLPLQEALDRDSERISAGYRYRTVAEIGLYELSLDRRGVGLYRTYLDSGYYEEQIERYLAYYDRAQMKVVFFEDLVRRPKEVMRELFEYLGVSSRTVDDLNFEQLNKSEGDYMSHATPRTRQWLVEHYAGRNRSLGASLKVDLSRWNDF